MSTNGVTITTVGLTMVLAAGLFWFQRLLSPPLHSLEPPLVKPRIPIFGHIISMMREKASFYTRLFRENAVPICTLPMLNGKMYIINSPSLVQSALRKQEISFDPFLLEFSVSIFGLSKRMAKIISDRRVMERLLDVIHVNLMGEPLHRMNVAALACLTDLLNGVPTNQPVCVPDTFLWVRDNMTLATVSALFGEKNPITAEHTELFWIFDDGAVLLALGIAPNLVAPEAVRARDKIARLLRPYYRAKYDQRPDVSDLIRKRASALRDSGFNDDDLSVQELMVPWVGTTNTIPTTFWLLHRVFSRPDYVAKIREEVEAVATVTDRPEGTIAEIPVSNLEKQCAFLHACYQETLRMYLHSVGNRRTITDVTIQDSEGREYLLKKGVNVQWPPNVLHFVESAWGEDADAFRPERFMNTASQDEKRRRGAFLPFGGGRNLCPGRRFALAEILGLIGALAVGFEIEGVELPGHKNPQFGQGPRQPLWGETNRGMTLRRRNGWENVTWKFV